MYFTALPFLPEQSAFGAYLDDMRRYAAEALRQAPDAILQSFLGFPVSAREHHVDGIHHAAFYIGDYRTDADVDRWLEFLHARRFLSDLRHGPSYIAPREYGTQGYWISCGLDGAPVEMFCNKTMGPWKNCDHRFKIARMSHFALFVSDACHVSALLTYFAHYNDISVLSYSERDTLGHTYGHLLNRKTECVLELAHSHTISTGFRAGFRDEAHVTA